MHCCAKHTLPNNTKSILIPLRTSVLFCPCLAVLPLGLQLVSWHLISIIPVLLCFIYIVVKLPTTCHCNPPRLSFVGDYLLITHIQDQRTGILSQTYLLDYHLYITLLNILHFIVLMLCLFLPNLSPLILTPSWGGSGCFFCSQRATMSYLFYQSSMSPRKWMRPSI